MNDKIAIHRLPQGGRWLLALLLAASMMLSSCSASTVTVAQGEQSSSAANAGSAGMVRRALRFAADATDAWREQSQEISEYKARYEAEFDLDQRVADHPYWIAETYMRRYQPGPEPRVFQTTVIYDRHGELIAELNEEGRRSWVELEDIDPFLREAIVATEDASFFENPGVDYPRLLAAFHRNRVAEEIQSGASTITMQLARHLFLDPEERFAPSYERKALEYYLARDLTDLYTKDEILEMYLNMIYFGHGAYGVEAAAKTYFDSPASNLTRGEATLLAGLPQAPSELDPLINLDGARARQQLVLSLMVRHGRIDEAEAAAVFDEELRLNTDFDPTPKPLLAPHFVHYLADFIDSRGLGRLNRSGYVVHATLDLGVQALAEEAVRAQVKREGPRRNLNNAALVAIQPGTAHVVAMVGSADYASDAINGQFNVATGSRQPGSAFKPVLYAAAFDHNVINPATILWDIRAVFTTSLGETFYTPANYDRKFHGPITARTALANSYNVPAVRLLGRVGTQRLVETAEAMGVTGLADAASYGPSLALGSHEVRLIDLVNAYHTLANEGRYLRPTPFSEIELPGDMRITADQVERQAIAPATAFQVTSILSDGEARKPMFGSAANMTLSIPAAVKTGTTDNFRDNWTVGYTRHLVAGVWAGNSDGTPMRSSTGASGAAPIWKAFMQGVIDDPALAAALDFPEEVGADPVVSSFQPSSDIALITDCPSHYPCRTGGEYFQKRWLAEAGGASPFADSFASGLLRSLPQNNLLYCEDSNGNQSVDNRRIYRLSGSIDELVAAYDADAADAQSITPAAFRSASTIFARVPLAWRYPSEANAIYVPDVEKDRFRIIAWTSQQRWMVSVGPCDDLWQHTVAEGETWKSIAQRFGVTSSVLAEVNRQAATTLRPGDRLVVPYGLPIYVDPSDPPYVVEEGDTWMGIATKLGVPFNALEAVNIDKIRDNYLLRIGDELRVPVIITEPDGRIAMLDSDRHPSAGFAEGRVVD